MYVRVHKYNIYVCVCAYYNTHIYVCEFTHKQKTHVSTYTLTHTYTYKRTYVIYAERNSVNMPYPFSILFQFTHRPIYLDSMCSNFQNVNDCLPVVIQFILCFKLLFLNLSHGNGRKTHLIRLKFGISYHTLNEIRLIVFGIHSTIDSYVGLLKKLSF